ncbi:MAG: hypothetical protein ACREQJ_10170, partial [Candidatus Binatia bacterium]
PTPTAAPPAATATPEATPTATPVPCEVEVLEAEPSEPFEFLGVVEVKRRSPAERSEAILESARLAACRMNADAIVILYRANRRQGGIAQRPVPRAILNDADLRAAVIRFRR